MVSRPVSRTPKDETAALRAEPLRVLLVEDSADDAQLVIRELRRGGYEPTWQRVDTAAGLAAALAETWDLVACDWVLPSLDAPAVLAAIGAAGVDVPVIIVSGEVGEEVAVTAMKAGAHDFVSKHRLARLVPAVERELREAAGRRAREQIEDTLVATEHRFRTLIEKAMDVVTVIDPQGVYRYLSPAVESIIGFAPDDLLGTNAFERVHPDDRPALLQRLNAGLRAGETSAIAEARWQHKDGTWRVVEAVVRNLVDDPAVGGLVLNSRDITARREMEHQLRLQSAIMANLAEGVLLTRVSDNTIVHTNPKLDAMFGYDAGELCGKHVAVLNAPGDRSPEQVAAEIAAAAEAGGVWSGEILNRRKDGSAFWCYANVSKLAASDYGPVWISTYADVTERRRAEAALRASEERLRTTMDSMLEGVQIIGPDWRYLYVNDAAARHGRRSREELRGRTMMEMYPGIESSSVFTMLRRTMERRVSQLLETVFTFPDQSTGYFELNIHPVPEGIVVLSVDTSDRRRAEDAIRQLNAELEQRVAQRTAELEAANRDLEAFTYSVSHDLRAPLRTIDGFARAVMEEYSALLPDEGRRYLATVRAGARRMGQLIEDLLRFAHLGRQPLHLQTVDTAGLVRDAYVELRSLWEGRIVDLQIDELPRCEGDPTLLKQVWINLLSNALKYTAKRPTAVIAVGCMRTGTDDVFFVRDNGAGFDMREVERLFKVFQRLHLATEFEGTGIGLAITQRVIQRHGGRIWAEGAVDRGATFFFTLGAAASAR